MRGEFLGGAIVLLGLLRLVAEGLTRVLRKLPRPRSPLLRLALGDLTRPGAATSGVITALGLGLTLLATVILLDRTIAAEVNEALPSRAPSFFFVDIQPDQTGDFDQHHRRLQEPAGLQAHADDPWTDHLPERRAVGRGQSRSAM